jgi:very-short-patch-repair endonuclease
MAVFILLSLLLVSILLLGRQFAPRAPREDAPWPLLAKALLSPREQEFHKLLVGLYPQHFVFAQVALSQLIDVRPGTANRLSIRNQFSQLVADFVLCGRDFSIALVIELDDPTHAAPDRQDADRRKTRAIEAAGMRLVRIPAGPLPQIAELRRMIQGSMGQPPQVAAAPTSTVARIKPAVGYALVGILVLCGCVTLYLRPPNSVSAPVPPARVIIPPAPVPSPPPTPATPSIPLRATPSDSSASSQQAEQKQLEAERASTAQQAHAALERRRQAAWAAYYQVPASCEHPPDWADQVECGNQYIRAKREFDKRWQSQLNPALSVAAANTATIQQ